MLQRIIRILQSFTIGQKPLLTVLDVKYTRFYPDGKPRSVVIEVELAED